MSKELNFEEDVAIDLDNLHMEWATHAQDRYKYGTEVAYLDKVVKQQNKLIEVKKTKLRIEESRVTLKIKEENPKATVQVITAELETIKDEKLIKAREALSEEEDNKIEIEYNLNMAKNALKAFDDKKIALENEVSLWKGNYFATPREERDVEGGKIIKEVRGEKVADAQRKTLNRRRNK